MKLDGFTVELYNVKEVKHWALIDREGRTYLELFFDGFTLSKLVHESDTEADLAAEYGLKLSKGE